jgi:ferredoxin-type protein NapH
MTTLQSAPARRPWRFDARKAIFFWAILLGVGCLITTTFAREATVYFVLGYFIVSIALSIGLFISAPRQKRSMARRLVIFLMGMLLLIVAIASGRGNMQIEGLFFGAMLSLAHPAVTHYLLAKIVGPIAFGRVWCGWACWFAAIFDQLPYKRSSGRLRGPWGWLRYAHFGLSLGLVLLFWFGFGYQEGASGLPGLVWFLMGLTIYFALGVGLAVALKDNRAFCKYLCPISVLLKTSGSVSALKITGEAAKCNECQACALICPMDIKVYDYIKDDERVLSTECTLCMACINACPKDALKISLAFDRGGDERLRERKANRHVDWVRGLRLRQALPFWRGDLPL